MAKKKQRVVFQVEVDVVYGDPGQWKRIVRQVRNSLKSAISVENVHIRSITSSRVAKE